MLPVPDGFLRQLGGGTDRTYAYLLVDHLRWVAFEGVATDSVTLRDVQRYMGAVGAEFNGPIGRPWRVGKSAYGAASLKSVAACLKAFYAFQGSQGVNVALAKALTVERLPTRADRRRMFLGHTVTSLPSNPLTPSAPHRRHPKMPPEGARALLVKELVSARDRMVVTWLADGGLRVGELCGLHLVDLHLREGAACGECRAAHVHIVHRETNPNGARAKIKHPWVIEDGTIRGGLVRRVSPAMIHTYFHYMTREYPTEAEHGMLLVQLQGSRTGEPLATSAVRGMLRRAGVRTDLGRVRPHSFRHQFATDILDASDGNAMIARDAGGWASAATVEQVYGHVDMHDPVFSAALSAVWERT